MRPTHRLLGAQGCLSYLRMRRSAGDTGSITSLHAERVGGTEYRAYIVHRPDIVRQHTQRKFLAA